MSLPSLGSAAGDFDDTTMEDGLSPLKPVSRAVHPHTPVINNPIAFQHLDSTSTPAVSSTGLERPHSSTIFGLAPVLSAFIDEPATSALESAHQRRRFPTSDQSQRLNLVQEISADQVSIDKVEYGSAGEEVTGAGRSLNPNLGQPSPHPTEASIRALEQGDETSSSQESLNAYYRKEADLDLASTSFLPSPIIATTLPALGEPRHVEAAPLTGRTPSPSILTSERARRISAAGLSLRRQPPIPLRKMSTTSIRTPPLQIQSRPLVLANSLGLPVTPAEATPKSIAANLIRDGDDELPSTSSPLRERNGNSMLSSPGMGRHASPNATPPRPLGATPDPRQHYSLSIEPSLSRIYGDDESALATPKGEMITLTAAQQRKVDILAAVRSTTKPRAVKGTPHPRHNSDSRNLDDPAAEESDFTREHAGRPKAKDIFTGANSHLLTLNSHLTTENLALVAALGTSAQQVAKLNRARQQLEVQVAELSGGSLGDPDDTRHSESQSVDHQRQDLLQQLQREVFELKDQLEEATRDADVKQMALNRIKADVNEAAERDSATVAGLHAQADEYLVELEDKEQELEEARGELETQETEFAEQMGKLEVELCRVMEEQEDQLEEAKADLEESKRESARRRAEDAGELEHLRGVVDQLEAAQLQALQSGAGDPSESVHPQVAELQEVIVKMEADYQRLAHQMASAGGAFEAELSEYSGIVRALEGEAGDLAREYQAQVAKCDETEESVIRLESQLRQSEQQIESVAASFNHEQALVASLSSQLAQLAPHKTKAKSPLANELFRSSTRDPLVVSLEFELDIARHDIVQLKSQLSAHQAQSEALEQVSAQVKGVDTDSKGLDWTGPRLREQISFSPSPQRTPEKSIMFKSVRGVTTPRTPGHYHRNVSFRSSLISRARAQSAGRRLRSPPGAPRVLRGHDNRSRPVPYPRLGAARRRPQPPAPRR